MGLECGADAPDPVRAGPADGLSDRESDAAIIRAREYFADYLGVPQDDTHLHVFIAATAGVMFHIAEQVDDPRDDRVLVSLLEAIDLMEQGLPM